MKIREIKKLKNPTEKKISITFTAQLKTQKIAFTQKGDPISFATFTDETGEIECVIFPDIYMRHEEILKNGNTFDLEGFLNLMGNVNCIWLDKLWKKFEI